MEATRTTENYGWTTTREARKALAEAIFEAWRDEIPDGDKWSVCFAGRRGLTWAGRCHYRHKEIQLNTAFAVYADVGDYVNTVIHEIAHAIMGFHALHGEAWKAKHRAMGGNGERRCGADLELSNALVMDAAGFPRK